MKQLKIARHPLRAMIVAHWDFLDTARSVHHSRKYLDAGPSHDSDLLTTTSVALEACWQQGIHRCLNGLHDLRFGATQAEFAPHPLDLGNKRVSLATLNYQTAAFAGGSPEKVCCSACSAGRRLRRSDSSRRILVLYDGAQSLASAASMSVPRYDKAFTQYAAQSSA
jgi:hypothetical protein